MFGATYCINQDAQLKIGLKSIRLGPISNAQEFNPLPLLFKALLQEQKDRVFFQRAFNLHTKTRAL
jgi:predicted dinucleotide-binding enzyme